MTDGLPGDTVVVLAHGSDDAGEVVLRRRRSGDAPPVLELVVDGVFAMDSAHVATEQALADLTLARLAAHPDPAPHAGGWRVLVGGLGLGFTSAALLADPRVAQVVVVELHACLLDWARSGLIPPVQPFLAGPGTDPRLQVVVGDVLDVVPAQPAASLDAVLLDVDNGPGFLVHPGNTAVYAEPFLRAAHRTLRPHGVLGVWSADPAPDLAVLLERVCGACEEVLLDVERDGRRFTYAVYLAGAALGRTAEKTRGQN